jgi:hypothetical protein
MMKKKRNLFYGMLAFTILGFFTSTFLCVAAYIKTMEDKSGAFGTIGQRSYFHCGTGTEDDPYVITRPRHLFNLSRLQALGVFSEKNYFQLGYDVMGDGTYGFFKDDNSSEFSSYLDMSNLSYSINSIGNEATPFYGVFDGKGMEIKNLTVHCDLEDSGLFGYVASRGVVENLLLDNVTIINDGYTDDFKDFYSTDAESKMKQAFTINVQQGSRKTSFSYDSNLKNVVTDSSSQVSSTNTVSFEIMESGTGDEDKYKMPEFSFEGKYTNYSFSLLPSDEFFTENNNTYVVKEKDESEDALSDVFSYFDSFKSESDATYPLTFSMTMSLVGTYMDSQGINYSKVVTALNVSFEKLSKDSTSITMYVQPRETEHGNNIGLIIGHCDGSCKNVFIHDGTFKMNSESAYNAANQKSATGFIGYISPSVSNNASSSSKGETAGAGKDVGVLDFTDIYESIIGSGSFANVTGTTLAGNSSYYTYQPVQGNDYMDYLRYFSGKDETIRYSTADNTIPFIGGTLIQDDDDHDRGLGVFKIATDYSSNGIGDNVFKNAGNSAIVKSKIGSDNYIRNDMSTVFYSTYEYNKDNLSLYGISSFDELSSEIKDATTSSLFSLGATSIPRENSINSHALYEAYYNYLFRFSLTNRSDFYFSDLDDSKPGGKFMNNYFRYKLVDEEGNSLDMDSSQFGLMIKNKQRANITQLTTNYRLTRSESGNMYVLEDTINDSYSVANSINFDIKTDYANVTVIASNYEDSDNAMTKNSMLGVYKLPEGDDALESVSGEQYKVPKDTSWDNPDYGMLLTSDNAMSFFDYQTNSSSGYGQIGVSDIANNTTSFNEITSTNNYTATDMRGSSNVVSSDNYTSYLKHPLYAHTFKLPKGKYCLGTAFGQCNVFYICAQGQDEGDISMNANVYSKINTIENVDFIKEASYDSDGKLTNSYFTLEDGKVTMNTAATEAKRCFLIFDSGNVTHFNASSKNNTNELVLKMKYDSTNSYFVFELGDTSQISRITNMTLTNYATVYNSTFTQTNVKLFNGTTSQDRKISYSSSN